MLLAIGSDPNKDQAPSAGDDGLPAVVHDVAQGVCRPLTVPPKALVAAEEAGLLYGPAVNKLTVMNYVTPAYVRSLEWVNALYPVLPHLFLTSCRDELVDKSLRILRFHRPAAQVAIGFDGGYVGHTSAAARSISDPETHRQGCAILLVAAGCSHQPRLASPLQSRRFVPRSRTLAVRSRCLVSTTSRFKSEQVVCFRPSFGQRWHHFARNSIFRWSRWKPRALVTAPGRTVCPQRHCAGS